MADDRAAAPRSRWWRRLGGIRVRTTAAAVVVVGIAMALAVIGMLASVERSLTYQVRDAAESRASQLARAPIADGATISVVDREDEFVQVLDHGRVVASSANVEGDPPLARPPPGGVAYLASVPFVDGQFLAVVVPKLGDPSRAVVVGKSLDSAVEGRNAAARALLIGGPLVLAAVGAVTWLIVGRALRPVEDIRTEVEGISSRRLDRRVPAPAGDDEIARLAATMNGMLDRIEQGQRRQRRFVSDASHELRSPVATIRQHAEVARAHPEGTSVEELAQIVLDEDVRLQRLVDDLLLLARVDEGGGGGSDEVDLDDVVLAEAARLRATTSLVVETRGVAAARVLGNRTHLERLVRNLTDNAARHARGRTALRLSEHDGQVLLSVEDDGPGIPPGEREHVQERFVRLDGARGRDTGGAGLGLSIVREVTVAHRGTVTMGDSSLGGLRVEIRLPSAG